MNKLKSALMIFIASILTLTISTVVIPNATVNGANDFETLQTAQKHPQTRASDYGYITEYKKDGSNVVRVKGILSLDPNIQYYMLFNVVESLTNTSNLGSGATWSMSDMSTGSAEFKYAKITKGAKEFAFDLYVNEKVLHIIVWSEQKFVQTGTSYNDTDYGNISLSNIQQSKGLTSTTSLFNLSQTIFSFDKLESNGLPPVINPGAQEMTFDFEVKPALAELLEKFTVIDDEDGDITEKLVVEYENYSSATTTGTYLIQVSATDLAGNKAEFTLTIKLIDETPPEITLSLTSLTFNLSGGLNNYDYTPHFTVFDRIDSDPSVIVNDSAVNYKKSGTYKTYIVATDFSGNQATAEITITIIDDVPPMIVADSFTIYVTAYKPISQDYFKTLFKAHDNETITSSLVIELIKDTDPYWSNKLTVGTYKQRVSATDRSGNYVIETFTIIVQDIHAPVIYFNYGFDIYLTKDYQGYFTEDIRNFLVQNNYITEVAKIDNNTYISNEFAIGKYHIVFKDDVLNETIKVDVEIKAGDDDETKPEKKAWYLILWDWLKTNYVVVIIVVVGLALLGAIVKVFVSRKRKPKNNRRK